MAKLFIVFSVLIAFQAQASIPNYPQSICKIEYGSGLGAIEKQFVAQNQGGVGEDENYIFRVLFMQEYAEVGITDKNTNITYAMNVDLSEPGTFRSSFGIRSPSTDGIFFYCEAVK